MAIGILDPELPEPMRSVVDCVVDSDVGVPHHVDDLPVGNESVRLIGESKPDRRLVPVGGREVRRIAVNGAREPQAVRVVRHRPLQIGYEQDRRDPCQRRHTAMLSRDGAQKAPERSAPHRSVS